MDGERKRLWDDWCRSCCGSGLFDESIIDDICGCDCDKYRDVGGGY